MKSAQPIRTNLHGAPFRIGELVRVARLSDATGDANFLRKCGRIVYFEYSCGCGQSYPGGPMIGVRFLNGTAEFWKEELRQTGAARRRGG